MSNHHSEQLTIGLGGEALACDLDFAGSPGTAAVICAHGFGSNRGGEKWAAVRRECAARGWTYAAFDFRGHGDSAGSVLDLRPSGLVADLRRVRDELRSRGVRRAGLIGSSMGGFAAAWFAAEDPGFAARCVLIAPAFRFPEARWAGLGEREREEWRRTGRLRVSNQWLDVEVGCGMAEEHADYPPEALAARWRVPTLIFHGMADDVVPYSGSVAWAEAAAHPEVEVRLFKGGDHRLTDRKNEIAAESCRFLADLFTPPGPAEPARPASGGDTPPTH